MARVDTFEEFIDAVNAMNKNNSFLTANSFFIIAAAKRRDNKIATLEKKNDTMKKAFEESWTAWTTSSICINV